MPFHRTYKPEYITQFFRLPIENQEKAGELSKLLNGGTDPKYVLRQANSHCQRSCEEPVNLNPIIYCNQNCPVWKIKNYILNDGKEDLKI